LGKNIKSIHFSVSIIQYHQRVNREHHNIKDFDYRLQIFGRLRKIGMRVHMKPIYLNKFWKIQRQTGLELTGSQLTCKAQIANNFNKKLLNIFIRWRLSREASVTWNNIACDVDRRDNISNQAYIIIKSSQII
jgi:hypothetical protein